MNNDNRRGQKSTLRCEDSQAAPAPPGWVGLKEVSRDLEVNLLRVMQTVCVRGVKTRSYSSVHNNRQDHYIRIRDLDVIASALDETEKGSNEGLLKLHNRSRPLL